MKLSRLERDRIGELCEQYGVARLEIFGSVAKGLATEASDVDILYTMKPGRRMGWDIDDLASALGEVFGCKVDLVSRKYVHPLLAEEVLGSAQELNAA